MKVSLPVAVLTLLGLLCRPADAQELKKLKVGYPAISYNQIHIWVAKDAGLFRKQGLDVEIVFFRGGQTATQALVAGDPPIVNIGLVVQAGLQVTTRSLSPQPRTPITIRSWPVRESQRWNS